METNFLFRCKHLGLVIVRLLKNRNAGSPLGGNTEGRWGSVHRVRTSELREKWSLTLDPAVKNFIHDEMSIIYTLCNITPIKQLTNETLLRQITMTVEHRTKLQLVCPHKLVLKLLDQAVISLCPISTLIQKPWFKKNKQKTKHTERLIISKKLLHTNSPATVVHSLPSVGELYINLLTLQWSVFNLMFFVYIENNVTAQHKPKMF